MIVSSKCSQSLGRDDCTPLPIDDCVRHSKRQYIDFLTVPRGIERLFLSKKPEEVTSPDSY